MAKSRLIGNALKNVSEEILDNRLMSGITKPKIPKKLIRPRVSLEDKIRKTAFGEPGGLTVKGKPYQMTMQDAVASQGIVNRQRISQNNRMNQNPTKAELALDPKELKKIQLGRKAENARLRSEYQSNSGRYRKDMEARERIINGEDNPDSVINKYRDAEDSLANEIADGRLKAKKREEYVNSKQQRMGGDHSQGNGNKSNRRQQEKRQEQSRSEKDRLKDYYEEIPEYDDSLEERILNQRKKFDQNKTQSKTRERINDNSHVPDSKRAEKGQEYREKRLAKQKELNKNKLTNDPSEYAYDTSLDDEILTQRAEAMEVAKAEFDAIENPTQEQRDAFNAETKGIKRERLTSSERKTYDEQILKNRSESQSAIDEYKKGFKDNFTSQEAYDHELGLQQMEEKHAELLGKKTTIEQDHKKRAQGYKNAIKNEKSAAEKLKNLKENRNTDGTLKNSVQSTVNKSATEQMKSTMGEQMGKWAPMVVGGGLVIAMANRGGQQTNAELYGQAPAYGGGY